MGPDEFHEKYPGSPEPGLQDNAYTNFMVVWTILKAKEILSLISLPAKNKLCRRLKITEDELKLWDDITCRMKIIFNSHGIIEQFKGYFKLKELDWEKYREKYGDISRMDRILKAEGKSPDEYKVTKQADVLMIFYLLPLDEIVEIFKRLGYRFNKTILRRNYDYYVKRTSHGSTLSKVVHCYLALLLRRKKEAIRWFMQVLQSDLFDTQRGTTAEGIHVGVMGGSIDLVIRGFLGINILEKKVTVNPYLLEKWKNVRVNLLCKGINLKLKVSCGKVSLLVGGRKNQAFPVPLFINNKPQRILQKRRYSFSY